MRDGAVVQEYSGLRPRLSAVRAHILAHPWLSSFVLFATVAALTRPATYAAPLEYDAPLYLYGGNVILHGGTPYVDVVDTKGPMTYLLFAAIRLVSGTSAAMVHITLVLFAALTAVVLAAYVGRFAGRAIGFLAGLVFAAFAAVAPMEGYSSNTEQYGVLPMVAAWWIATDRRRWSCVAAGALTAAAVLMNPAFAVAVPFVAWELWRSDEGGRARRFLLAGGGVAGVVAPIFLWLGLSGALGDMFRQIFGYADSGVTASNLADKIQGRGGYSYLWHVPAPTLWFLGVAGCLIALRDPRLRRVAVPALLWIVAGWARVKVANYSYVHHYYPALPGIVAGIAVGLGSLWRRSWLERAALCVLVLAVPLWKEGLHWQLLALKQPGHNRFWLPDDYQSRLSYPVAAFIRAHTASGDRIYVAGGTPGKEAVGAPGVYWLAGRFSPTRYIDTPPARWVPSGYRAERLHALMSRPPKAIGAMAGIPVDQDLRRVLRRYHYRLSYTILGARVWLRPA